MQTRAPLDISPPIIPESLWFMEEGMAVLNGPPIDAAISGSAFRSDGQGGIEISVGTTIEEDSIWKTDGSGGITLNLAS